MIVVPTIPSHGAGSVISHLSAGKVTWGGGEVGELGAHFLFELSGKVVVIITWAMTPGATEEKQIVNNVSDI